MRGPRVHSDSTDGTRPPSGGVTGTKRATTIAELRDALGVRTSDNLQSALVALVVEGQNDRISLGALLPNRSELIRDAIADGRFAIETLTGGGNLIYRLSSLQETLCRYHVFLDSDRQGITKAQEAEDEGMLLPPDRTFAIDRGRNESELEDLLALDLYWSEAIDTFNVDLRVGPFRQSNSKWSSRVRNGFRAAGQAWTPSTLAHIKSIVASRIEAEPQTAIHPDHEVVIASVVRAVEKKLNPRVSDDDGPPTNPPDS